MRRGFGLLQALLIIILVSGIMVIAMKYATVSVKQTKDLYIRESAELFMNSAVELSLLAIQDYNRTSVGCLDEVNITSSDRRFKADINITKYYVYKGDDNNGSDFNCTGRTQHIQTEDSHGMVMLEVTVESSSSHPKNGNKEEKVKLHRRTLQRP